MDQEVRIFDKTLYEGEPPAFVPDVIAKLESLGPAVIAVRGPGFSANLLGVPYVGKDGDDPVFRVKGCDCHVHIMWKDLHSYRLGSENVGYGPEPVLWILGKDGEPVVNLFYPEKPRKELEVVLQ